MVKPKNAKVDDQDRIQKFEESLKVNPKDQVARPIMESISKTIKSARAQSRELLFETSERARVQRQLKILRMEESAQ